ncbi:MAG: M48 family metallopeptidase [Clostridia bacterium]|nr:M48 family metallopeptidase [Clostridia bacterium]
MYDTNSPLNNINVSFSDYVQRHATSMEAHLVNGVPDYSFSLDNELRKSMMKIPHFTSICKTITSSLVAQQIQILNQEGIAVGPNQFPEIYRMTADCAQKLGIGIPNVFIVNSPGEMNAYTIAADDSSPIVVLYSSIVERMTPGELKGVIAHECGHIHNNHSALQSVVNVILSSLGGSGIAGMVITLANIALMQFWTRAAEITADRAALICADDVQDVINMNSTLLTGGMIGKQYSVNLESLREQLEITLNNPSKVYEVLSDHPSSVRRVFCTMEFSECETFFQWRPDFKRYDAVVRTKEETDRRCQKLVNILDNVKGGIR